MNKQKIEDAMRIILQEIGEDINREGIKYTPARIARLYENMFYGYKKELKIVNEEERNGNLDKDIIPITVFEDINSEMLIRKVNFISCCEHHNLVFPGVAWIGIIPEKLVMGLNKIDKVVKYFAARLQVQERMTNQIADWINDNLKCKGIFVVIKGVHYCAEVQNDNGDFTTSAVRGAFLTEPVGKSPRQEFLRLMGDLKIE